jgi:hypothetical protein
LKLRKVLNVTGKWDANAFSILSNTRKALAEAGVPNERIEQVVGEATSGTYAHLLCTCIRALEEAGYEVR